MHKHLRVDGSKAICPNSEFALLMLWQINVCPGVMLGHGWMRGAPIAAAALEMGHERMLTLL